MQRRTERGQVRQFGAWETPYSSPKNEALINPPTMTPQHLTPSSQLDHTQVEVATHIIYQRRVCVCVHQCIKEGVCGEKTKRSLLQ